jgi:hypothetical protein
VKLREERERDEIIIREQREQLQFGGGSSMVRRPNTYSRVYY